MDTIPKCCEMRCDKPAEFEIFDTQERRPDCGSTYSCGEHIDSLLGSVSPTKPIGPWMVYDLEGKFYKTYSGVLQLKGN